VTEEQAQNLVGALSLALSDRVQEAVTAASGQAPSAAAALSALRHFEFDPSIDLLGRILGLTSSGTVRLVDRLAEAGLVRRDRSGRTAGTDARVATLRLTPAGRRAAGRITAARARTLQAAMLALSPEEREQLGTLAGRVMAGMARPPGAVRWGCRMCDTGACRRYQGGCPVATAAERAGERSDAVHGRPPEAAERRPDQD
jgi:MarR family transcriptional repressor of emrRAB